MSRATTSLVATPSRSTGPPTSNLPNYAVPTPPMQPSPGTFRHPRLTEIIKRQSAASLTSQKIQNAVLNAVAILVTLVFNNTIHNIIESILVGVSIPPSVLNASTLILFIRLLFMVNIILCLRPALPYISKQDDVVDIPLTPSQRALLGLTSSSKNTPASATASAGFVTPPRYRRDGGMETTPSTHNSPLATSTGRRSISANYASSPMTASRYNVGLSPSPRPSPVQSARTYRLASDSTSGGSPSGSPLFQRAATNDLNQSTFTTVGGRGTLANSTSSLAFGLSRSQSLRERKPGFEDNDYIPGTPSPNGTKRQPGINYKWLYDKGARLPRSESTAF